MLNLVRFRNSDIEDHPCNRVEPKTKKGKYVEKRFSMDLLLKHVHPMFGFTDCLQSDYPSV